MAEKAKSDWARAGVIFAAICAVAALAVVPEVRQWLRLKDHPSASIEPQSKDGTSSPPHEVGIKSVAKPTVLDARPETAPAREQVGPVAANLAGDWSDTDNPFGPWTIREGNRQLPGLANWGQFPYPQPAWAPSSRAGNFLPAWFKAAGAGAVEYRQDWRRGDVVVHTTDSTNGASSGIANVLWTSSFDGAVSISGGVWNARNNGRANMWLIMVNGHEVTSATLFSNDGHDRENPYLFSAGSGGPGAVSRIPVRPGTTISLQLRSTTQYAEFVGVRLSVTPVSR